MFPGHQRPGAGSGTRFHGSACRCSFDALRPGWRRQEDGLRVCKRFRHVCGCEDALRQINPRKVSGVFAAGVDCFDGFLVSSPNRRITAGASRHGGQCGPPGPGTDDADFGVGKCRGRQVVGLWAWIIHIALSKACCAAAQPLAAATQPEPALNLSI